MRDLTIAAVRSDPELRRLAVDITSGFGVTGPVDAARSVESFVRSSFIFVDEPEELLIDPSVQLHMLNEGGVIRGDCDDAAMLTAALLYNIGLMTRFKAVIRGADGSYQHVFTEYMLRGLNRWIPIDPTIEGIPVYGKGDYIAEVL